MIRWQMSCSLRCCSFRRLIFTSLARFSMVWLILFRTVSSPLPHHSMPHFQVRTSSSRVIGFHVHIRGAPLEQFHDINVTIRSLLRATVWCRFFNVSRDVLYHPVSVLLKETIESYCNSAKWSWFWISSVGAPSF